MKVLGLSPLDKDSTVTLVEDGDECLPELAALTYGTHGTNVSQIVLSSPQLLSGAPQP